MNTDLQNALYKAWPQTFRQKELSPADTSMCWGIQCEDGWAGLIGALCEVTTAHARTGAHPVLAATTVKEKLASLRVHFNQRCEFCDGARRLVEALSTRVCEVSGRPGVRCALWGGGVKTLAPEIAVQLGFEVDQPAQPNRHGSNSVPAGWHGIVESLIEVTTNCGSEVLLEFGSGRGRLSVTAPPGSNAFILGAAAAAIAASIRTDAETWTNSGPTIRGLAL
jgi:hypothetical protein